MRKKWKNFWQSLGPGLVTGMSDNDPGGIGTVSIAGAQQGYNQLWVMVFILPFMIALQEMSARIGALTGCGLTGNIKRYYPKWLLAIAAGSIVIANTFNIGADIYGMSGAVNLMLPINIELLAGIISIGVVLMTIFLPYHRIVTVFKWLSLTFLAYIGAFFMTHIDWASLVLHTFIPTFSLNKDFLVILFAVLGTTISPYLYFWQASEEAEEVRQRNPNIKVCKPRYIAPRTLRTVEFDTKIGMISSNIVSFFVMALTAGTLFHVGTNIQTLREVASALRPIAGPYATLLFTIGILGSGILSIPVLAGSAAYVLAELFGWEGSLDNTFSQARHFYTAIILSVAIGLVIPFLGISPIQALLYSGVLNGLISPILILLIIHMSSNPEVVGVNTTRRSIHWLGYASFFLMMTGTLFIFIS